MRRTSVLLWEWFSKPKCTIAGLAKKQRSKRSESKLAKEKMNCGVSCDRIESTEKKKRERSQDYMAFRSKALKALLYFSIKGKRNKRKKK